MLSLFNSVVRIERMGVSVVNGMATSTWTTVTGGEYVRCRLDLNFLRPGKDIPPAAVAGKAPDRIGLMFCDSSTPIKAGDRVVTILNDENEMPVSGTFEIRVIPDLAQGFSQPHHMEIQILETNQALDNLWPDDVAVTP